ncbi:MAG TPA: hypothetical protein VFQ43_03520 [Nitrososphaera sp.]|nr:hypothetical protein [Nitrososphaera sp.]
MYPAGRQKQHERFLLERFIEAAGLATEIVEQREAPDFIVRFEGRLLGIEVTELFILRDTGRSLLQAQESMSIKIVSRARQLYEVSSAPPAHITVVFGLGRDLRNLNRDRTASRLAFFVQSLNLAIGQQFDWRPEKKEHEGPIPDAISSVHALGVPTYEMAHWRIARVGWASPVTVDALQFRINEKSRRLLTYRNIVSENWLVIVADRTKPSGLFHAKPNFDPRGISSPFSRTFLYLYPERPIIQLGVSASWAIDSFEQSG